MSGRPRIQDVRGAASPRVEPAGACGDLLVTFGASADAAPPRFGRAGTGAWRRSGGLWLSEPSEGWKGYPLRTFEAAPWTFWLLGEIVLPAGADLSALLTGVAAGREPARRLNGHLLVLAWNERSGQWHVWTDRFGTVHAYVGRRGSTAALGTCFASVAGVASSRRLDWPALAGFLACGFFPDDRTFYDDVRILRPATHVVLGAGGQLVSEERWAGWTHRPEGGRAYDDTVAEFAETLHSVLDDETLSGRIAVPISGGLDSRTTLAALTRPDAPARERVWSYSYGYGPGSEETRIARRAAAARGVSIETLEVGPYLFGRLPSVLGCVEGFQDVTQARQAVATDLLAKRSDAVIAAHWGDVWLDDMGLAGEGASAEAVASHAFAKVAKRGRAWLFRELAAPRLPGQDPEEIAREFVRRGLEPLGDIDDPDFRVKAFKTEQWSFRWTLASLRMYQAGAFPKLPFYDSRMADFFETVPTSFVSGRRLQIDYLRRFAPDLARLPWQAVGTDLFSYRHFDTWLLPWRVGKKLLRLLRRTTPAPERNWEVQFGGSGHRALEDALLAPGSRLLDLVERASVQRLLADFSASPFEEGRGYTVSMLLTLSAFLETHG